MYYVVIVFGVHIEIYLYKVILYSNILQYVELGGTVANVIMQYLEYNN